LFAITILGAIANMTISRTVGHALDILDAEGIAVGGAARVAYDGREMATILVKSEHDVPRSIEALTNAGIEVKAGAAGF
jgi:hypothetical protein